LKLTKPFTDSAPRDYEPPGLCGQALTRADYDALATRWIDRDTATQHFIRRADSATGSAVVGRNGRGGGDYSGLLIPYLLPGTGQIRDYRLRRDHPDVERGKPRAKYVSPPGRGNMLYFPVGTDPAWLMDSSLPVVITEGEFKTMALMRAALHDRDRPRWLSVGLGGVWNWRGRIGRTNDADGNRVDLRGPIPDLARIGWDDRRVLIIFDADLAEKEQVQIARAMLTKELSARAARVSWFRWPEDRPAEAKGIDDLLAALGPQKVLPLIEESLQRPAGTPQLLNQLLNDTGNAERLVALHGPNMRYCHEMRGWLIWDGRRWKRDNTGEAQRLAKHTMHTFVKQALPLSSDKEKKAIFQFAVRSLNERQIARLLILAQSELYVQPHELDAHPLLLNALNGTIELDTGTVRPHRRGDYLTKLVPVDYRPGAPCHRWNSFLNEILDKSLHDYIQRAFGYSLTGVTIEKAVFVLHGPGNSGKTTLLTTFRELVGEYAVVIQADTLMSRAHDTNNTQADLCDLRGARFVHTSECEADQRLSQARLKAITQGMGQIKATRKYENPITFAETHKLWLDTNDRPGVKNVDDEATFNRLHSIPFPKAVPKDKIDPDLAQKLKAEAEGILAWAVTGAIAWSQDGLDKPADVKASTEEWRAENDNVGQFISDCCVLGEAFQARAAVTYRAYRQWAERSGEKNVASDRQFSQRLIARGHERGEDNRGRFYRGIGLRAEPQEREG
jgi:putative DNA primase/helicase